MLQIIIHQEQDVLNVVIKDVVLVIQKQELVQHVVVDIIKMEQPVLNVHQK